MAKVQKKYAITRSTVTEVLNEIDAFITKTKNYMEKNPSFKYEIEIDKHPVGWRAIVKFERDE